MNNRYEDSVQQCSGSSARYFFTFLVGIGFGGLLAIAMLNGVAEAEREATQTELMRDYTERTNEIASLGYEFGARSVALRVPSTCFAERPLDPGDEYINLQFADGQLKGIVKPRFSKVEAE